MYNRLVELLNEATDKHGIYLDKIANYLLAHRVIAPPCKPGDTIWYLDYELPRCFMSPEKHIVQDIVITAQAVLIRCDNLITLRPEDFGKIAFTSKEEAEAKLNSNDSI